jgi:hypothetical protein
MLYTAQPPANKTGSNTISMRKSKSMSSPPKVF